MRTRETKKPLEYYSASIENTITREAMQLMLPTQFKVFDSIKVSGDGSVKPIKTQIELRAATLARSVPAGTENKSFFKDKTEGVSEIHMTFYCTRAKAIDRETDGIQVTFFRTPNYTPEYVEARRQAMKSAESARERRK